MGLNLLIGILVVLILLIVADGLRRVWRDRQGRLRLKIEARKDPVVDDEAELRNPELPSGGARTIRRDAAGNEMGDGDDQQPPVMMEADDRQTARETRPVAQAELFTDHDDDDDSHLPSISALPDEDDSVSPARASKSSVARNQPSAAWRGASGVTKEPSASREEPSASWEKPLAAHEKPSAARQESAAEQKETAPLRNQAAGEKSRPRAEQSPPGAEVLEVIVMHLVAPRGERFPGRDLLQQLLENGLRFGEMNIFHYHQGESLQFSMANAVEPGTFDIDEMDTQEFAGVTFFLKLPGPSRPVEAIDRMLAVVRKLAQELGGELKDEQRSVLTPQTMEHMRQRVQEFERRQRLARH